MRAIQPDVWQAWANLSFQCEWQVGISKRPVLHKAGERGLEDVCLAILEREELSSIWELDTHKSTALHYAV
jgi:hypothetical protein